MRPAPTSIATLVLLTLATACTAETSTRTGSLSLALTHTTSDGEVYRLHGTLTLGGAAQASFTTPQDAPTLTTELEPGDYTLTLEPGWRLERVHAGSSEPVEATLLSDNPQPFTIDADTIARLELRFMLEGGEVLDPIPGTLEVALVVEPAASGPCSPGLVINEVDYDQEGADDHELVELLNAGACAVSTDGLSLVLYNGGAADGVPVAYASVDLAFAAPSVAPGGYVVVADAEVLATLDPAVPALELPVALQNGDPDGIALELDHVIVDAISYGGMLTGVGEGTSAPPDPGAGSLGRCPDGSDRDDNGADFILLAEATPGAANACP